MVKEVIKGIVVFVIRVHYRDVKVQLNSIDNSFGIFFSKSGRV
jgi:hypothetical protein